MTATSAPLILAFPVIAFITRLTAMMAMVAQQISASTETARALPSIVMTGIPAPLNRAHRVIAFTPWCVTMATPALPIPVMPASALLFR